LTITLLTNTLHTSHTDKSTATLGTLAVTLLTNPLHTSHTDWSTATVGTQWLSPYVHISHRLEHC